MRIAVLDLSYWPPEFMSGQPRFGEVLRDWVARGLPDAELSVLDIVEGTRLPSVDDYDGYVISGSDKGVYDEATWMADLRRFLLQARDAGKPLLGVCFGHQIMADTFGGKAGKVGRPEVGVRNYEVEGRAFEAHVWHQDQVIQAPPGTKVIASAPYCPIGGLEYDFPAISVQFHPEYPASFISSFLSRGRGKLLDEDHADTVLAQLSKSDVSPDLFADRAGRFFRDALAKKAA